MPGDVDPLQCAFLIKHFESFSILLLIDARAGGIIFLTLTIARFEETDPHAMADLIHDLSVLGLEIAQKEALPVPLRTTFVGNTVSVIPEPETYLMLVAGLGLLGFMVRHRNRAF